MVFPSRRYFFFGAMGAAIACRRRANELRAYSVSIVRANSYSADLEAVIRRVLVEHQVAVIGKNILLKPNLVEFSADVPINTNPIFVAAVENALRGLGAKSIRIGEGPGHRRTTLDLAWAAGYNQVIPGFESKFTDLNLDEISRIRLHNPFSTLQDLYLPHTALGCDLLISLPKMKTHHWAGATLSMKNLFGLVPGGVYGWPKNLLHWAGIDESIADLHKLFPRQFCLVDGIDAMEGNGPILGTKLHAGVIIAGHHPPSVDSTCCRIMQIDPNKVKYLKLTAGLARIKQLGERIEDVTKRFELIPELRRFRLEGGNAPV